MMSGDSPDSVPRTKSGFCESKRAWNCVIRVRGSFEAIAVQNNSVNFGLLRGRMTGRC